MQNRIGLVLGAGGVTGHGFHVGVLSALHDATGWDPRTAEVIVGTSAGAEVAALLRAGLSAGDLAARAAGAPMSGEAERLLAEVGPPLPVSGLRPGRASIDPLAAHLRPLYPDGWPDRALWICVTRRDGLRRVVLGRDASPRPDVGTAVAASCAVPGWFAPVEIDGRRYLDGGVWSTTNFDLLAGLGLDQAVVIAPLARVVRRARLAAEAWRVRAGGTRVVRFEPTVADLRAMGWNALDERRRGPAVEQARASTCTRLARRR